MATVKCEAVKMDIVKRRGRATIEWYKNKEPQYYCYGYIDAQNEELLDVCLDCQDHVLRAQQDYNNHYKK